MPILSYTITQEIIDRGCGHKGNDCPNYHAAIGRIRELGWRGAWFSTQKLYLYSSEPTNRYYADEVVRLPEGVSKWINWYDKRGGMEVEPATFAFEIPFPPKEGSEC